MSEPAQEPVEPDEEPVEPDEEPVEPDEDADLEPEEEPVEPEEEPAEDAEDADLERDERCEATTEVGGTDYRCSLTAGHEEEHAFQAVEESDAAEDEAVRLAALELRFQESRRRIAGFVQRYRGVLAEEMGAEFANLCECPLCMDEMPGYFFVQQVEAMGDEQRIAVRMAIGEEVLPDYQHDPYRERCGTCDGWGRVDNDSRVPGQRYKACDDCAGMGFKRTGSAPPQPPAEPLALVQGGPWAGEGGDAPAPVVEADPWGTPVGAPHYGVLLNLRPVGWEEEVAAWKIANGGA